MDGVPVLYRATLLLIELRDCWFLLCIFEVSRSGRGPTREDRQSRLVTLCIRTLFDRGSIGLDCVARIELPADSKLDTEKRDGLRLNKLRRLTSLFKRAISRGRGGIGASGAVPGVWLQTLADLVWTLARGMRGTKSVALQGGISATELARLGRIRFSVATVIFVVRLLLKGSGWTAARLSDPSSCHRFLMAG